MSRRLLTVLVLGVLAVVSLLAPSLVKAGRKPRFPACPGGVFVVIGDPLIAGGAAAFEDRLQLGGGQVALFERLPINVDEGESDPARDEGAGAMVVVPGSQWTGATDRPDRADHLLGRGGKAAREEAEAELPGRARSGLHTADESRTSRRRAGTGSSRVASSATTATRPTATAAAGTAPARTRCAGKASSSAARSATSPDARRASTARDATASRTTPRPGLHPRPRRAASGTPAATPATAAASAAPRATSAAARRRPVTFRSARPARTAPRWATVPSATPRTAAAAATASSPAASSRVTPCPIPTTCC